MNWLSWYLDQEVIVTLTSGYKFKGLLQHYHGKEYYVVLRDGSRTYFKSNKISSIKYAD